MDTLVLSHAYVPVARVGWQRAISLLWEGKVEVIEEYENRTVRSVTLEFKVPSIIRFLRKIRDHKRALKFSRENVFARDHGSCQYCGRRVARPEATYDHVTPRSQGGQTRWENVVICCVPCNQRKGGRAPEQAGMQLRSIPVKPKSLPETLRLTLLFDENAPPSWRQFRSRLPLLAGRARREVKVEPGRLGAQGSTPYPSAWNAGHRARGASSTLGCSAIASRRI